MQNIVLVGIGPNAKVAYSFIRYHRLFNVIGFAVNQEYLNCSEFCGLPVYLLENVDKFVNVEECLFFVTLLWNNLNADRRKLYDYCMSHHLRMANLISPLAIIRGTVHGDNCWIQDYVVVQNDAMIGADVAIMSGVLIGPDSNIGNHCFLGAHAIVAGGCTIGEQTFIGLNSTVFDDLKVGSRCVVGAASALKRNLPNNTVYKVNIDSYISTTYSESVIESKLQARKNVR